MARTGSEAAAATAAAYDTDVRREVGPEGGGGGGGGVRAPIEIVVDAPLECAARCWDAGFTVQVHDRAAGEVAFSVLDPFGRRIDLVSRTARARSRGSAGEEEWR